jgi:hypothetical protein
MLGVKRKKRNATYKQQMQFIFKGVLFFYTENNFIILFTTSEFTMLSETTLKMPTEKVTEKETEKESTSLLFHFEQEKLNRHLELTEKRFRFLLELGDYEFYHLCIKRSNSWTYQMFMPIILETENQIQSDPVSLRILRLLMYQYDIKLRDEEYRRLTGQEYLEASVVAKELMAFFHQFFKDIISDWSFVELLLMAHCLFSVSTETLPLRIQLEKEEKDGVILEDTIVQVYDKYCSIS